MVFLRVICLLLCVSTALPIQFNAVFVVTNQLLENSPVSGGVLAARAVRAGHIQIHGAAFNTINPELICNPAPCLLPNVQVSEGGAPVNEHVLAANPKNSLQLFSGGNDFNCASIQGLYTSNDGGSTWTHTCMPTLVNNSGEGDVVGDYDLNGVLYAAGIDTDSVGSTSTAVVTVSRNNGTTWSAPRIAVPADAGNVDKPWLVVDKNPSSPFANRIYVSATQFGMSTGIAVSHSADGGRTWSTMQVDTPTARQSTSLVTWP